MITDNDHRKRRCPRLGHELPFSYCRKPGDDIPCSEIYDCWWEVFDIKKFMEDHYTEEIRKAITAPRKPKTLSLLELIQQAQERARNK